ncbi:MAG: AAA family ATPase, partial [Undibacterium sp.]
MTIQIRTAERKQSKLRIGLSSPSGGGKTYSALLLAKGLVGDYEKIGLIDSENGRGDIYSDLGKYKIVSLKPPFTPESYIEAIRAFENAGVDVIIIDSVTHEWDGEGGCLQLNEQLAIAKYRGNTWSAWSETTPRHQRFLDAITSSSCHVITTVRNKVETVMAEGKVKKVGMKEIQREGFEYELTVNFTIDRDSHAVVASKDNTRLFEGKDPFVITEATGEVLRDWVASGAADKTAEEKQTLKTKINGQLT